MALFFRLTPLRAALQAACFIWLAALQGCALAGEPMILPTDAEPLTVTTAHGPVAISVELAISDAEHERGLMFRAKLADGHGMLFVMDETRDAYFWMKNTPEALDMAFIAEDGRIAAIKRGEPYSEAVIASGEPVRFVLEIAAGEASRLGLAPGQMAQHRVIGSIAAK